MARNKPPRWWKLTDETSKLSTRELTELYQKEKKAATEKDVFADLVNPQKEKKK